MARSTPASASATTNIGQAHRRSADGGTAVPGPLGCAPPEPGGASEGWAGVWGASSADAPSPSFWSLTRAGAREGQVFEFDQGAPGPTGGTPRSLSAR